MRGKKPTAKRADLLCMDCATFQAQERLARQKGGAQVVPEHTSFGQMRGKKAQSPGVPLRIFGWGGTLPPVGGGRDGFFLDDGGIARECFATCKNI